MDVGAPAITSDSTFILGSAGKFVTHIVALQLVEQGSIELDEPIYEYLPELESLPLIKHDKKQFTLQRTTKKITLRHLLSHTSGLSSESNPLISEYLSSGSDITRLRIAADATPIVKYFSIPLIFEPGEGFAYGYSVYWIELLIARLRGNFYDYVQKQIFDRIGMTSSTYRVKERPDLFDGRLRMMKRDNEQLACIPTQDTAHGLLCSARDIGAILSDLISPSSRLLSSESVDLLFTGQLTPASNALAMLRGNDDNYSFCSGKLDSISRPPLVNWCPAGLLAEAILPISLMPKGTVTWEGMPNVLWAMNREKRIGMFFGTQLVPVGDKIANGLALLFMRNAWNKFGI